MYQYQRQQIKKRMEEKELQLQTVSKEREDLKSKLSELQGLVTHFMAEKGLASPAQALSAAKALTTSATPSADLPSVIADSNGELFIGTEGGVLNNFGQV